MLFNHTLLQIITSYFLGGVVSLVIITNPLAKIPLFLSLSRDMSDQLRREQAFKACLYAFIILTVSLFGGVMILKGFGISYGALRVAGGLTVAVLGYRMLFQFAYTPAAINSEAQSQSIAFFPLAMPGISGPGAIAVVIGISSEIAELKIVVNEIAAYAASVLSIFLTCLLIWCTLHFAQVLSRWVGRDGMDALSRLMGFIMICIGVQFVGSGIRTFISGT